MGLIAGVTVYSGRAAVGQLKTLICWIALPKSRRFTGNASTVSFIAKPWALNHPQQTVGTRLGVAWLRRTEPVADVAKAQHPVLDPVELDPALLASLEHHAKAGDVNTLLDAIDRVCGPAPLEIICSRMSCGA